MSRNHNSKYKISAPKLFHAEKVGITDAFSDATPWFSHQFICQNEFCIKKCSYEQIKNLIDKIRVLSSLEWKSIESSPRETHGFELIPVNQIKGTIPQKFSDISDIMVFRFGGNKRGGRIAGTRKGNKFHILFIDHNYKLYNHN